METGKQGNWNHSMSSIIVYITRNWKTGKLESINEYHCLYHYLRIEKSTCI